MRIGWRPVWIGALFGLLFGFGGGAGTAMLAEARRPLTRPIAVLPSTEPPAPRATGPATPAPSAGSAVPVEKNYTVSGFLGSTGPAQPSKSCGSPTARLVRFRVLVEPGLATTPARFVEDVLSVLCDERSWIGSGDVRFRYDPNASLLIGLRTPESSERRCRQLIGLSVNFYYSCAGNREVVLNSDRWFTGSRYWPGSVPVYRQMLVNHEVGHTLGEHHRGCPRDGAYAPVMMQQSKGLTTDGNTCKPNPWPRPYELRSI